MLIVKRDPLKREIIEVAPGRRVIEYLNDYDHDTDFEVDVYVGNEKLDKDLDFGRVLHEGDILTISYRPGDPVTAGIIIGSIVVTALVVQALTPDPEIPNTAGQTSSSPNNSVSGQTNTVRKYEGIPNIYGRVFSYPDLIANSIPEWISNRKQVRELFLIGEGEYQINQVRDGTTDINDIPSSSATVYGPNTYPSDLLRANFSGEVTGQELVAADDPSILWSGDTRFLGDINTSITYSASGSVMTTTVATSLLVGDTFTLTGTNAGTYTVTNISYTPVNPSAIPPTVATWTVTVAESFATVTDETATLTSTRNYLVVNTIQLINDLGLEVGSSIFITGTTANDGEFTIDSYTIESATTKITVVETITTQGVYPNYQTAAISNVDQSNGVVVGPFTMPTDAEQIWINLSCPRGIISESGGAITLTAQITLQEIDNIGADVGSPITQSAVFTGKSYETQGQTIKFTGLGGKRFKVSAKRTTAKYSGSATDFMQWDDAFTINSYDGARFGDVTVVDVVAKSSNNQNSSSRKINVDVTRKLNGVATTNFADAVVDLITNKGGRPVSEIDTDELYAIANSLSDDLKEFSFTFDDKNISLGEAVQTVCNVARVKVYRDGQMWRFTRDEAKPRTYLFNRRNLASGENQNQTFKARQPDEFDSVRLRYYNRDIEDYDDVLIKIDATSKTFTVGTAGAWPKELELAGCSNYAQALNRAHMEARKVVYQRWSVEDVALSDAANTTLGDRVAWGDIYDGELFEGEIRGNSGTTYYTSERITFKSGVTYYALVTNENGEVMGPVTVSAVAGNEKAFVATLPESVGIADSFNVQAGSKYMIGTNEDLELYDFSVTELGESGQDGRVSIKLVQYSDNIYEMD